MYGNLMNKSNSMVVTVGLRGLLVVALLLSIALSGFLPPVALAQNEVAGSQRAGLSISPAVYEEQHEPGSIHSFTLRINNLEDRQRTLFLAPRNIIGVEAGGVPVFASDEQELTGFELASWIDFSTDVVEIAPNASESVTVVINVPEDAPPGSHFGGINVSSRGEQMERTGAGVNFGVTNIVTVLVDGELDERAMIRSLSTDRFVYGSTDVGFTARVENMGNVLQRPIGPLEVTNMFGATVASLTVNEPRAGVYPRTERVFTTTWSDENPGFGRYQATLSMVYGRGGANQTMTNTVSFWILPLNIIGPAALILGALLLIAFVSIRIYVRRAIAKHTGGTTRRVARSSHRATPFPFWLLTLIVMLAVTAVFLLILLVIFA